MRVRGILGTGQYTSSTMQQRNALNSASRKGGSLLLRSLAECTDIRRVADPARFHAVDCACVIADVHRRSRSLLFKFIAYGATYSAS